MSESTIHGDLVQRQLRDIGSAEAQGMVPVSSGFRVYPMPLLTWDLPTLGGGTR